MEDVIKFLKIKPLPNGSGYGSGDGSGYGGYGCGGYGSGDGSGDGGDGYGYGDGGDGYGDGGGGDGYGYGCGSGDGWGDSDGGLKSLNNNCVYLIDGIETIIENVKGVVASGFVVNKDLSLTKTFVVKNNYFFAHGKTIKEAKNYLIEKTLINLPIEQRIENFKIEFPDLEKSYSAYKFFEWHYYLTGSCKMGRESFCLNNNIKMSDKLTVAEFVELTKNQYGSEIIIKLKTSLWN